MAVKGEAGRALGMSALASAIGGIFSVIVLIIAAPLLARLAYSFGPPEYFALAVFGLSMVALTGGDSAVKNLIAGAFGVMLATVGQDITTGVERYTFGIYSFTDGIEFIPVLIGLFALSELLEQAAQLGKHSALARLGAVRLPSFADFGKCSKAIWLSCGIGTFIGALPALGATTAAMIAYVETKRWSKNKRVRQGAIEGVAGPEAANNAAVGGAMVPTLAARHPRKHHHRDHPRGPDRAGRAARATSSPNSRSCSTPCSRRCCSRTCSTSRSGWGSPSSSPASLSSAAVPVAGGVRPFGDRRLCAEPGDGGSLGSHRFRLHRLLHAAVRLLARAAHAVGLVLGKLVEETLKQSLIIFDLQWSGFLGRPIALALLR